ncbi:MAG: tRNA threonylcarbamoyladenosine dehydratase [Candidatus Omnitrophota bacterium]
MEQFICLELLVGKENLKKVRCSRIVVIGLGAVGSYVVEALARFGVGNLRLVDFDLIKESNLNRHLHALTSTIGRSKAALAKERVLDINPRCNVEALEIFAAADSIDRILEGKPDLVIDAIDSLNPKAQVLSACYEKGIRVISSMGAATRTEPFMLRTGDLYDTRNCPLAKRLRGLLKKKGVGRGIICISSEETRNMDAIDTEGVVPSEDEYLRGRRRKKMGSLPTITGIFGLLVAHVALDMLCGGLRKGNRC